MIYQRPCICSMVTQEDDEKARGMLEMIYWAAMVEVASLHRCSSCKEVLILLGHSSLTQSLLLWYLVLQSLFHFSSYSENFPTNPIHLEWNKINFCYSKSKTLTEPETKGSLLSFCEQRNSSTKAQFQKSLSLQGLVYWPGPRELNLWQLLFHLATSVFWEQRQDNCHAFPNITVGSNGRLSDYPKAPESILLNPRSNPSVWFTGMCVHKVQSLECHICLWSKSTKLLMICL